MRLEQLRSLVRPLVTLLFALGVVAGFFVGKLSAEQFQSLAIMVISFWFVSRTASKGG